MCLGSPSEAQQSPEEFDAALRQACFSESLEWLPPFLFATLPHLDGFSKKATDGILGADCLSSAKALLCTAQGLLILRSGDISQTPAAKSRRELK